MQSAIYYRGLACLFTHELDAVTHSEWQILFVLRDLPDAAASSWFVSLHVPLFFGILWLSQHSNAQVRRLTRMIVAAFLCVHAGLHLMLWSTPESEFHGALSAILIASAGILGLVSLLMQWRQPLDEPGPNKV